MKKLILVAILAASLTLVVFGCSKKAEEEPIPADTAVTDPAPAPATPPPAEKPKPTIAPKDPPKATEGAKATEAKIDLPKKETPKAVKTSPTKMNKSIKKKVEDD